MKSFLPAALVVALAVAPGAAIGEDSQAPSDSRSETPESVHVQPRGRGFAPGSARDHDIQRKLDNFNATQRDLDKALDKKLTICRRC